MTAGTNEKHEENSTSISGNTTTTNSEHETGSVTIPGDDHGAPRKFPRDEPSCTNAYTLKTSVTSLSGPVEYIFEFPAKQDLAPICIQPVTGHKCRKSQNETRPGRQYTTLCCSLPHNTNTTRKIMCLHLSDASCLAFLNKYIM